MNHPPPSFLPSSSSLTPTTDSNETKIQYVKDRWPIRNVREGGDAVSSPPLWPPVIYVSWCPLQVDH